MTDHTDHVERHEWHVDCDDCQADATAIDWLVAVRRYGLAQANAMFPEEAS
jgi:hypothetical protein